MANWSDCVFKFRGNKEVLEEIKKNIETYGVDWGKWRMPNILKAYMHSLEEVSRKKWIEYAKRCRADKQEWLLGLTAIKKDLSRKLKDKYGANNWYDFAMNTWGTACNLSREERIPTHEEDNYLEYSVSCDWNGPYEWFVGVCEHYGVSGEYVDAESGNDFFVRIVVKDGKEVERVETEYVSAESIRFFGLQHFIEIYEGEISREEDLEEIADILLEPAIDAGYEIEFNEWYENYKEELM